MTKNSNVAYKKMPMNKKLCTKVPYELWDGNNEKRRKSLLKNSINMGEGLGLGWVKEIVGKDVMKCVKGFVRPTVKECSKCSVAKSEGSTWHCDIHCDLYSWAIPTNNVIDLTND